LKQEVSVMKSFRGYWIALVVGGMILAGVLGGYRIKAGTAGEGVGAAQPQDTFGLERRINSLEQRLYSIELSINRLEQQSATNARTPQPGNRRDVELELLQTQIRTLHGQLGEVACGLSKLDERTLSASVREAQRRSGRPNTDPCRLDPETPLRLSTR
jgi:hypothetical protein